MALGHAIRGEVSRRCSSWAQLLVRRRPKAGRPAGSSPSTTVATRRAASQVRAHGGPGSARPVTRLAASLHCAGAVARSEAKSKMSAVPTRQLVRRMLARAASEPAICWSGESSFTP